MTQFCKFDKINMMFCIIFFTLSTFGKGFSTSTNDTLNEDNSTAVLTITPIRCKTDTLFNFSWTTGINETDIPVDVRTHNSSDECTTNMTYATTNNSIVLPGRLSFPDYFCDISSRDWKDLYAEELIIRRGSNLPDFIINRCSCNNNTIQIQSLTKKQNDFPILQYIDNVPGSTRYNLTHIRWLEANAGVTCKDMLSTNANKVITVFQSYNYFELQDAENMTVNTNYSVCIFFNDRDKPYCSYLSNIISPLEGENVHSKILESDMNYTLLSLLVLVILISAAVLLRFSSMYKKISSKLKNWFTEPRNRAEAAQYEFVPPRNFIRQEFNLLYTPPELLQQPPRIIKDPYEIPSDKIEKKVKIGGGAFGNVFYAKAHGLMDSRGYTVVAVKILRENAPPEEKQDFLAEIQMLKRIVKHRNIVRMLACVTKSQPYMIVMELVLSGDLKQYLLDLREIWTYNQFFKETSNCVYVEPGEGFQEKQKVNGSYYVISKYASSKAVTSKLPAGDEIPVFKSDEKSPLPEEMVSQAQPVLDNKELENFALQIASGMAHLEKLGITHRDLAARNILVTRNKVLKISDFGMSRLGTYVNKTDRKVPLRWWALEALENFTTNNKTDVWSFGVVLWEIGTLGAFPYGKLDNNAILPLLKRGFRLSRPKICTDEMYTVILRCWIPNPQLRPSFSDLVEILSKNTPVYVEFSKINSTYVFPLPVEPPEDENKGN